MINGALESPIDRKEFDRVFAALAAEGTQALIVGGAGENLTNRRVIVELATKAKLPTIYPVRDYVVGGGLLGYVVDIVDLYTHAARQVAQILNGSKAGDIPFYQASTFKLVINLKTANDLGLTIPPTLLARADEVIE